MDLKRDMLGWILTCLIATSCGLQKDAVFLSGPSTAPPPTPNACNPSNTPRKIDGLTEFKFSVLPALAISCGRCHAAGGAGPTHFAGLDVERAYSIAKERLNLTQVASSGLFTRGTDGHCQPCVVMNQKDKFLAQLSRWAQAENGTLMDPTQTMCPILSPPPPPGEGIVRTPKENNETDATPLPEKGSGVLELRFPLSSIGISQGFAVLDSRIVTPRTPSSLGVYEFKNLRIVSPASVRVRDITLKIREGGREQKDKLFSHVNTVVAPNFSGNTVSARTGTMTEMARTPHDVALVITELSPSEFKCFQTAIFSQKVVPVVTDRCASCHSSQNNQFSGAFQKFPMQTNQVDTLCKNFLLRMRLPVAESLILVNPQGAPPHPLVTTFTPQDREAISSWYLLENPQ